MVSLQADDFSSTVLPQLEAAGYLLTLCRRYDPTVLEGTTPKAIAFRYEMGSAGGSFKYRTKTVPRPVPAGEWWLSATVVNDLLAAVTAAGG